MQRQEIHYHKNEKGKEDAARGIVIDWKMIQKAYNALKIPKKYHRPHMDGIDHLGYIIDMSDRSRGKTTNKLILGLLLYCAYGIQLHYIRQNSEQCELRYIKNLYETVVSCGYIEKITEGKYNHIMYRGKRWYLQLLDEETGKVLETDPVACCVCFGLDEATAQKSIYNAPRGDMIFFDEFVSNTYGFYDYINFTDLCKTIIRDRISPIIYMSANTINRQSAWFDELFIRSAVEKMEQGTAQEISTEEGTHIYIEILPADNSEIRQAVNKRFFGFGGTRTAAITGRGTWASETYPHIPREDEEHPTREILNQIFLLRQNTLLKLKVVEHPTLGIGVFVMPATRTYDDSVIFTADDLTDARYVFAFGKNTGVYFIWELYMQGRFWYANNTIGGVVKSYVSYAQSKLAAMRR